MEMAAYSDISIWLPDEGIDDRMLRKIGWLTKLVAAGLILSFLSIWTTGYIVTSYVETLLKQFNMPLEVPPMAMSGVWGTLWGADPLMTTDTAVKEGTQAIGNEKEGTTSSENVKEGEEASGNEKEEDLSSETGSESQSDETDQPAANADDHGGPPVAVDAFGEISEAPLTDIGMGGGTQANGSGAPVQGEVQEGTAGIDGTETAITTDDLTEVKNQMSDEDKEQLLALLMSKLPQESWQTISQYVENGLTEQELTAVQQIMAQHLDKEEYEQMMDILKKY